MYVFFKSMCNSMMGDGLRVCVHKACFTFLPTLLGSHAVLIFVFAREKCLLPLQLALESKNMKLAQHALAGIQVCLSLSAMVGGRN